jgi:hypothetical protein
MFIALPNHFLMKLGTLNVISPGLSYLVPGLSGQTQALTEKSFSYSAKIKNQVQWPGTE